VTFIFTPFSTGALHLLSSWKRQVLAHPDAGGCHYGVAVESKASACAEVGIARGPHLAWIVGKAGHDDRKT